MKIRHIVSEHGKQSVLKSEMVVLRYLFVMFVLFHDLFIFSYKQAHLLTSEELVQLIGYLRISVKSLALL